MCRHVVTHIMLIFSLKIVALNKTKERMRPYHVHHENEDPDIKKIKKVINTLFQEEFTRHVFFFFSATCPQHEHVLLRVSELPCLTLLRCRVS